MTAVDEIIEGEARDVSLVPVEQHVERLDETATPEAMVGLAARMATALSDIVERKKLYASIQGKKYPTVEAWMTVGRMDNVAAREIPGGIHRIEGGGWEAEVELIRLSDEMRVGYGSALCGTEGDRPWDSRPVHVQRSMAVTRATSRAFRQRYSWVMAIAGYEPTPADEMPHDERHDAPSDLGRPELERRAEGMAVKVEDVGFYAADTQADGNPRWKASVKNGSHKYHPTAEGALAEALGIADVKKGDTVLVWGRIEDVPWERDGKPMTPMKRIHLERIETDDWKLPAQSVAPAPAATAEEDLSELPW